LTTKTTIIIIIIIIIIFPDTCYPTEGLVVLAGTLYFQWERIKSFQIFSNSPFTYKFNTTQNRKMILLRNSKKNDYMDIGHLYNFYGFLRFK